MSLLRLCILLSHSLELADQVFDTLSLIICRATTRRCLPDELLLLLLRLYHLLLQ